MRFYPNGPSIPDDLLIARDEGRVVFFCGAGVSIARARLADFFGLAQSVLDALGVGENEPSRRLLNEAKIIDKRTGLHGLISADRVFGLLERDFLDRDIAAAVAQALRPPENPDLSAHQVIVDLATTLEGNLQLVTTNFDRLFGDCAPNAKLWHPPRLPDPTRRGDINGIVHLHGCVTPDYSGAEADGFVLSSSEFGRAYLSEGWATAFFREIISRYSVVFIGYAADDPPVQYLLEALNSKAGKLNGVYAFQGGTSDIAAARWRHKGVEAIHYSEDDGHHNLWTTLAAWAERAKAPADWYNNVLARAASGPEVLMPHERGQVAHIVSTAEGAKRFAATLEPAPADWLCVFDAVQRFAKPGHRGVWGDRGPFIDPFELYGLDSDITPKSIEPDDHYAKRDVPADAWDGLRLNRLDQQSLKDENLSTIRGHWAVNPPRLAGRLASLGHWIQRVAGQPATVWWAVRQGGLHPDIMSGIRWSLGHGDNIPSPMIRAAWRYLSEAQSPDREDFYGDWDDLKSFIVREGWSDIAVRRYADIKRPHLVLDRAWIQPAPPKIDDNTKLHDIIRLDVKYPELYEDLEIPEDFLISTIRALRRNLELAVSLESELGGYALTNIVPLHPDADLEGDDNYSRGHGLSAVVLNFSTLMSRLCQQAPQDAVREFNSWPRENQNVFLRLRLWVSGIEGVITNSNFIRILDDIHDDAFWDMHHQRDLLLTLAKRWPLLDQLGRRKIERRIIKGRSRWLSEKRAEHKERSRRLTLARLIWLTDNGCDLSQRARDKIDQLKLAIGDWSAAQAKAAAGSMEPRGGWVRTDKDHSGLLGIPLTSILTRAQELSGRQHLLTEKAPFSGLSEHCPVRAFSAIRKAGGGKKLPVWAWDRFLHADARKTDNARFVAYIAERIIRASDEDLSKLIRHIADWLSNSYETLSRHDIARSDRLLSRLINILALEPAETKTGIVRGDKAPDWTMESINSATGKISQALFDDPRKDNLKAETGFPADWIGHVDRLLKLPGDLRRHALVIFAHNMNWFYHYDAPWTQASLVSVLDGSKQDDRDAVLSGFFWSAHTPNISLYKHLKPHFLSCVKSDLSSRRKYGEVLVGMILAGWASRDPDSGERLISDEEMRAVILESDDEFRTRFLWQIRVWSKKEDAGRADVEAGAHDDDDDDNTMRSATLIQEFLSHAWPRHKSAKSPAISAALLELAFLDADNFPERSLIVLPLLVPMERAHTLMFDFNKRHHGILDKYPEELLTLLYTALPDDIHKWPYGTDDVLKLLSANSGGLRNDPRLLELLHKWNST